MKKIIKYILILSLLVTSLYLAIYLPNSVLTNKYINSETKIEYAPAEYYEEASDTTSEHISRLLTIFDKIKLISGLWANTYEEVDVSNSYITENEAFIKAYNGISYLYNLKAYPIDITAVYDCYYTYETKLYEYKDISYNSYKCYLWNVKIKNVNASVVHDILMTEDGVILQATINYTKDNRPSNLEEIINPIHDSLTDHSTKNLFKNFNLELLTSEIQYQIATDFNTKKVYPNTSDKDVKSQVLTRLYLSTNENVYEDYIFYQTITENQYIYGILPYEVYYK